MKDYIATLPEYKCYRCGDGFRTNVPGALCGVCSTIYSECQEALARYMRDSWDRILARDRQNIPRGLDGK